MILFLSLDAYHLALILSELEDLGIRVLPIHDGLLCNLGDY